jgi:hypothetical protein
MQLPLERKTQKNKEIIKKENKETIKEKSTMKGEIQKD